MEEPTLDQNEIDALLGGLDDSGGAGDIGGGEADAGADAAADDIMAGLDDSGGGDDFSMDSGGGSSAASDDDLAALLGDDSSSGGSMDSGGGMSPAPAPKAAAPRPAAHATSLDVPEGNLEVLLDVPLEVVVELGRTDLQIKDILNLAPGSVVELNRMAGEPINIMVNGKLVARGEVVVIDENFGVKIIQIISPMERLSQLN